MMIEKGISGAQFATSIEIQNKRNAAKHAGNTKKDSNCRVPL